MEEDYLIGLYKSKNESEFERSIPESKSNQLEKGIITITEKDQSNLFLSTFDEDYIPLWSIFEDDYI